jgi:hypothetical protein
VDEAAEFCQQTVSWIGDVAFSDQGETLAGRAAKDDVDLLLVA